MDHPANDPSHHPVLTAVNQPFIPNGESSMVIMTRSAEGCS